MTKDELIELINHTVYENENGDITGEVMNMVLNAIVATMGIEANPDDEATGTLNKIKIGEEVFDVEGGGSIELPDGALYGGIAWPNEPPTYGDDHRYFYLAIQQGNYPAFGHELDGNSLVLFYWLEQDQAWYSQFLAVTPVGLQTALAGYLESNELYLWLGFDVFYPYSTYSIGDFVTYEGGFFVFVANHPAGQWDEEDVAEASLVDYITDYVSKQLSGKQDVISDLSTIRSGAEAGATAYQKPSGGIPASDLASGVIPNSVVNATSQQDGTVVLTMANGDTIIIDLNHQHPNYYSKVAETSQPSGGMLPDVTYKLGTLTGATTFSFAVAVSGNMNHYYFTFISGTTAVIPTWPASITSWDGNCVDSNTGLPVIAANKTYEVSVLDGNAIIKEW